MSSQQREIIFSAKDNGVESTISRIKQSATQLGRDMMKESISNTSNAKDAVKYYEEQIRLIEKRSRVEQQANELAARKKRDIALDSAKDPSERRGIQEQYKQSSEQLKTSSKEDQLQVELLRELIEEMRSIARDEHRGDETRANQDRVHRERLSNSQWGRGKEEARNNSGGEGAVGALTSASNSAGDVLAADSAGGAMGSMIGMMARRIPIAAAAYGIFKGATSVWGAKEDQELQLRELAGLSGRGIGEMMQADVGGTRGGTYGALSLNVSREEFRSQVAPQTARAYGSVSGLLGSNGLAMQGLEIQKGMGVGPEIVHSLEKMTRTVSNANTAQFQAQSLYRRMDAEGTFGKSGGDMSRMQDIMQSYVELQSSAFMRHGEMSSSHMMVDLLGRFEKLGGVYKDDQYKTTTIQSLDRGLSSSGTPEIQAIKMGILRQLNPEMGYFDLKAEMDMGVQSEGYLKNVMSFVRNTGGDENSQKILLDQLTGGQMRASDIKRMIESDEFDMFSLGMGGAKGGDRRFDFKEKALNASSEVAATTAGMNEWWDDKKTEVFDFFDQQFGRIDKGLENLGDYLGF